MSNIKKHVGRIKNTDRRCVVVFMQLPDRPDHALVVDTDALPDNLHDALQNIVQSHEGQNTSDLSNLLARRIVPHLGIDMLNVLYKRGSLQALPIDNIVMYPLPNTAMPLRQIIELNGGRVGNTPVQTPVTETLENRYVENQRADASEGQVGMAMGLIRQAEDLEGEARNKRERAYQLAPQLRPAAQRAELHDGSATISMFEAVAPATESGEAQVTVRPDGAAE